MKDDVPIKFQCPWKFNHETNSQIWVQEHYTSATHSISNKISTSLQIKKWKPQLKTFPYVIIRKYPTDRVTLAKIQNRSNLHDSIKKKKKKPYPQAGYNIPRLFGLINFLNMQYSVLFRLHIFLSIKVTALKFLKYFTKHMAYDSVCAADIIWWISYYGLALNNFSGIV